MSKLRRYKSTRKYRCPYCDKTATRDKLGVHVEEKHSAELPEGYTGARAVYDFINKKNYGTCLVCKKKVYEWDDKIGRYKNICDNPKCLAALKKRAGHNHLEDPEIQKKMLEGRKISGKYTFSDGVTHSYVGSYERNCFEFMDTVMNIPGKDIMSPGPIIMYEYKGEFHTWILDWMYIPAMLCCDVKDGGSNPNSRPMEDYRAKQLAKEEAIQKDSRHFNYIRLTDNNFGQLLSAFADIRMGAINSDPDQHIYINESTSFMNESIFFNEEDIYYNKDKFDSGEINLCFITGLSGSGKTSMAKDHKDAEHYELDDIFAIKDRFTMDQLKEYGDLIYSYFKGPGKKFYVGIDDLKDVGNEEYEDILFPDFIEYCKKYAKSHPDKKFIVEGIEIFGGNTSTKKIPPESFKDYAFYIKGTSAAVSMIRATKRDSMDAGSEKDQKKARIHSLANINRWKWYFADEKVLKEYKDYFKRLMKEEKKTVTETVGGIPSARAHCDYIVPRMMSGLDFEDRSHLYFGNTGSDKVLKFDAEGNPIFIDKKDVYAEIEMSPKIVLGSDTAYYFNEEELRALGEDGLIEKLTGKEYHGMTELLMEKVVEISNTIDSDFLSVLVTNGMVKNMRHAILDQYIIKEELIDSKDNVIIYKDDDGYYMTTPGNYLVSPHYQNYTDITPEAIKLINDMYDEYIKRGGVI